ncbi:MAG TPA: ATP-binding protein [Gammaproteobacteria bacterium]|nr:ATP-binding protein [Gammaproteobacteria bacterium]
MTLTAPRLLKTTAFRLSLLFAVLYSLLMAGACGFIYWASTSYIDHDIDVELQAEATGLVHLFSSGGREDLVTALQQRARYGPRFSHQYLLLGPRDEEIAGNLRTWPATAASEGWHTFAVPRRPSDPRDGDSEPEYVRARTVALAGGYHLLVGESLDAEREVKEHIFGVVAGAIGFSVIVAMGLGVLMGRSVLSRIDAVSHAAGEVMGGELSRRLPVSARSDEFDELAARLNAMLERIEQLMSAMRQVTDNVAHDLRSPLNRIRNQLEVTLLESRNESDYRTAIETAVQEADGLIRTFNALLSIAQAEAGVRRNSWHDVDLSALGEDLAELYGAVAEEQGLAFHSELTPDVHIQGNRDLLAQALSNLLENAMKYTPAGGRVSLRVNRSGGAAQIEVTDSGPGIPAPERERVMQRFVRLDPARSSPGNGLGLSLVRAVAHLHRAAVQLDDNRPGLKVTMVFRRPGQT